MNVKWVAKQRNITDLTDIKEWEKSIKIIIIKHLRLLLFFQSMLGAMPCFVLLYVCTTRECISTGCTFSCQ